MLRDPIVAVTVMMGMIIIMVMIIAMMHLYMTATTYAPVHSPLPTSLPPYLPTSQVRTALSRQVHQNHAHTRPPRNSSRPKWHDESTASPLPYALSSLRPPGCRRLTDVRPRPLQLGGATARSTTRCSVALLLRASAPSRVARFFLTFLLPSTRVTIHNKTTRDYWCTRRTGPSRWTLHGGVALVGRRRNHGIAGSSKWKGTHTYLKETLKVSRVCTNHSGYKARGDHERT
jgi:hypothetical protein